MKEIKFEGKLKEKISKSKSFYDLKGEIKEIVLAIFAGIGLVTTGIVLITNSIATIMLLASILCVGSIGFTASFVDAIKAKKEKKKAKSDLNSLANKLQAEGIEIDYTNLQNALFTEEREEQITIDRNDQKSYHETIINKFYMLDKEDQVKVIKQVKDLYKINNDVVENEQLFLLEDNDLVNEEIPSITKSLTF